MFKFNDYPLLIDYHNAYIKIGNASTKTLIKIVDHNVASAEKKFEGIGRNRNALIAVYSRIIFDIFVKIKPKLLNRRTNSYESWDIAIGNDFEKIPDNERIRLVNLVEEEGIYRLPPNYYV